MIDPRAPLFETNVIGWTDEQNIWINHRVAGYSETVVGNVAGLAELCGLWSPKVHYPL
jgi:hypothetical protein